MSLLGSKDAPSAELYSLPSMLIIFSIKTFCLELRVSFFIVFFFFLLFTNFCFALDLKYDVDHLTFIFVEARFNLLQLEILQKLSGIKIIAPITFLTKEIDFKNFETLSNILNDILNLFFSVFRVNNTS